MAFKKLASEFFGTFGLIFCGCGAMTINEITNNSITHVGVAITWGIVVMSMIYAFGETSGAHFNPAVTIAFTIAKKFKLKNVLPYLISQLLGALFAIIILYVLFPESESLGSTIPIEYFPAHKTFILEFILTFILMFVILKVSTGSKELGTMAAIAIGGIVLLEAMFAGPITKASMNPFRSIAPAIISGNYHQLWVYILAPTFGAITAVYANKVSS
jgi:aquaporin NIP